jgi:hypothetical protein
MKFIKLVMLESVPNETPNEDGITEQQFVDRNVSISNDSIEGIIDLSPGRCMVFTKTSRQLLVKGEYQELLDELSKLKN